MYPRPLDLRPCSIEVFTDTLPRLLASQVVDLNNMLSKHEPHSPISMFYQIKLRADNLS